MKVGIINVTGYAGAELARILNEHREVEITSVTGRSGAGKRLSEVFPHLSNIDLNIDPELSGSLDFVFSALPHAASAEALTNVIKSGTKAVDISADFRIRDLEIYTEWYKVDHPCPELMEFSTYGLPELHRESIKSSPLAANPGCYPTASILGLAPALESNIVEAEIIVDAKSGVSGAGRSLSMKTHFSEVNENLSAYGLDGHRHMPEIKQELEQVANNTVNLTFLPHLIPMTRGILASCYVPLKPEFINSSSDIQGNVSEIYKEFYANEQFTKVVDSPPMTKQTLGSNDCLIYPTVDERTGRLIVISCIDNLVKGAAGQAVQNMNIMCGLPEDTGIRQLALYP
ncbi:MAG: N-acetyl-gamma-glutamyl-phosphate reductase [Chloroflexi bacterium]|nr:N-acetyl-gamma-glutamyl-phosphate reductase [Chloroflexota bacterium]|tara:strand:+ start:1809 stop:2840 length:1032 start_codon:yes stop_codon:yes gene_type:complete